jgi:hypothetical protein
MRRGAKPGKAKVEPKRPVARKSLKNERSRVRQLQKRLWEALKREAEAREQQTATSEILRAISRSPTDVQPVFDTIVRSAVQLSGALMGGIYRFDGELIHLAGVYGMRSEAVPLHARDFPRPPDRGFLAARAILERRATQMPDVLKDSEFQGKEFARVAGWRSSLSVPMLRDGQPIGAISVARAEPGLVPEAIVALFRTFADQAVIAVENGRLFTELQARNRDLTQALEQQTATAEVLRVIGSSPTDAQPVFEAIVSSARRLLSGFGGAVYRVCRLPAVYGLSEYAEVGGLLTYGPNRLDMFRHAVTYVDKILKGAKPADLPVEQPRKFELVINLKTAKALELTIPPSLLSRADEVIQ